MATSKNYIPIAIGSGVGLTLAIVSQLVNTGKIPLSLSGMATLSNWTLLVWPSSLMLMEVDPLTPIHFELATLYLSAIFLNGLLYAGIVAIWRRLVRAK
jgi:hypothetical protein